MISAQVHDSKGLLVQVSLPAMPAKGTLLSFWRRTEKVQRRVTDVQIEITDEGVRCDIIVEDAQPLATFDDCLTPSCRRSDERIRRYMEKVAQPNSMILYQALKNFEVEIRHEVELTWDEEV